jgi:5'-3' exonuclease
MLLIDTSYLIFYRCYALKIWMSKAYPDINLECNDLLEIPEFMEKYKTTFLTTIEKIMKREGQKMNNVIFLRDCSSENIWRRKIFPEYKSNRDYTKFNGKSLFQWTYDNLLSIYSKNGSKTVMFDELEADDVAAIIVKWMSDNYIKEKVVIITNDNDYLQLLSYPYVSLINLKQENLIKRSLGNPHRDLLKKIIMGDPSDNITKVFERCGEKTLLKYTDNPIELENALNNNQEHRTKFEFNQTLIDFNKIPKIYSDNVMLWCYENIRY